MRLEARGVSFRVGPFELVRRVDLAVEPGEFVAVVGANGAGKSTLVRLLAGDLRPSGGTVLLGGKPLDAYGAGGLARLRSVLPQQSRIEFAFTVRQVVEMGRSPYMRRGARGKDEEGLIERAMAAADVARLSGRAYPGLSGGEQARTCLARVLAQDTPVVLLDEPTAALDIRHQHQVLGVVRGLAEHGKAVLAVLHDLNLAAAYATRVVAMHRGGVAAAGCPEEVLTGEVLSRIYEHPVEVVRAGEPPRLVVLPRAGAVTAGFGLSG
ncbi:heme ABC transporter ATP-binding protein [Tepidiforma thermophila]|uniref:Iron complex transport system ATP-binding protein n=1 Tax=Tepidiforma thermophila (strain KCTC 52669 / CGMCC 1.13589 / G233) TaxID=2761530 RepID=A0A2A9HCF4_TEPT2|nr:heme ABC transporter ATP-binding protein [Tepidiforma thermophila]PFG72842.1 iron complex transport system ATP-binding protein [Tepidiforma thermophila]